MSKFRSFYKTYCSTILDDGQCPRNLQDISHIQQNTDISMFPHNDRVCDNRQKVLIPNASLFHKIYSFNHQTRYTISWQKCFYGVYAKEFLVHKCLLLTIKLFKLRIIMEISYSSPFQKILYTINLQNRAEIHIQNKIKQCGDNGHQLFYLFLKSSFKPGFS